MVFRTAAIEGQSSLALSIVHLEGFKFRYVPTWPERVEERGIEADDIVRTKQTYKSFVMHR